jgi:hypothetical protein
MGFLLVYVGDITTVGDLLMSNIIGGLCFATRPMLLIIWKLAHYDNVGQGHGEFRVRLFFAARRGVTLR